MEYTIKITEQDICVLSDALVELPYKIVAPLIDKLNRQIAEQQKVSPVEEQKPTE